MTSPVGASKVVVRSPKGAVGGPGQPGEDPSYGRAHTGLYVRPYGDRTFCRRLDVPETKESILALSEEAREAISRIGEIKARPIQLVQVLAVGPDVKERIVPGAVYLMDPWDSGRAMIGDEWYFFPTAKYLMMEVDA